MNLKLFKKRLIALYACWRKQRRDLWENSDVLVICTPPPGNPSHPISSSFFSWLLGHEFPDTIAVFTRNDIHFLCAKKKGFSLLQNVGSIAMEAVNAKVTVHARSTGDNGLELMDGIIRGMRVTYRDMAGSDDNWPLIVGYISGELPKSKLLWNCFNNLKPKEFRTTHVIGFSRLLNHDQDVRYSGKSEERRDLELFEESISDYRVGSKSHHGNCAAIQMESLPDNFEQMLALTPERREEAPREADDKNDKKLQSEKGKGEKPVNTLDEAKQLSHSEELGGSSREHVLVSGEEDEWVLVEDDGEEEYIEKRDKVNVKHSMALANYRL